MQKRYGLEPEDSFLCFFLLHMFTIVDMRMKDTDILYLLDYEFINFAVIIIILTILFSQFSIQAVLSECLLNSKVKKIIIYLKLGPDVQNLCQGLRACSLADLGPTGPSGRLFCCPV